MRKVVVFLLVLACMPLVASAYVQTDLNATVDVLDEVADVWVGTLPLDPNNNVIDPNNVMALNCGVTLYGGGTPLGTPTVPSPDISHVGNGVEPYINHPTFNQWGVGGAGPNPDWIKVFKGVKFEGDILNKQDEGRKWSHKYNWGGDGGWNDWQMIPMYQLYADKLYDIRAICNGSENDKVGHAPYEGTHDNSPSALFAGDASADADALRSILMWSGSQNVGNFQDSPVKGERDMTYIFKGLTAGNMYRAQVLFFKNSDENNCMRVLINGIKVVDSLNPSDDVADHTTEGIIVRRNVVVTAETLEITVGRRQNFAGGDDGNIADIAAVMLEDLGVATDAEPIVNPGSRVATWLVDNTVDVELTEANVIDDGTVDVVWTATGPATVSFDDDETMNPTATFTQVGDYTLTLTASDGTWVTAQSVAVKVYNGACDHAKGENWSGQTPGDINNNCKVDLDDFALLASHWLNCNSSDPLCIE